MGNITLTPLKHTRVYQEAVEDGRQEESADIIVRQLKKLFRQELSEEMRVQIESLPLPTLHRLTEDLLDFTSLADLESWLEAQ